MLSYELDELMEKEINIVANNLCLPDPKVYRMEGYVVEKDDLGIPVNSKAIGYHNPPSSNLFFDLPPEKTAVRHFTTGATRSADTGRIDPEGFLSPIVLERFSEYMNKHRVQPDGSIRDSDNWQKGVPQATYMKGLWRHFLHLWTRHRGFKVTDPLATANIEEDLCSIMFNAQGMLFELIKDKNRDTK